VPHDSSQQAKDQLCQIIISWPLKPGAGPSQLVHFVVPDVV
jgi:hypothetical protein